MGCLLCVEGPCLALFGGAVLATGPRRSVWHTPRCRPHGARSSHTTGTLQACDTPGRSPCRDWRLPADRVPQAGSAASAPGQLLSVHGAPGARDSVRRSCAHLLLLVLLCLPRLSVGTYLSDERPQPFLLRTGDTRELPGACQGCWVEVFREQGVERAGRSTPMMGGFAQVPHGLLVAALSLNPRRV